jgi:hypothetical protein
MEGREKEATAVAEQALRLSRESSEHGIEAWVLRVLDEVAARRDPPDADTAERHYRTALTEMDMRFYLDQTAALSAPM